MRQAVSGNKVEDKKQTKPVSAFYLKETTSQINQHLQVYNLVTKKTKTNLNDKPIWTEKCGKKYKNKTHLNPHRKRIP